jgi:heptosyltransferase-2
MKRFLVIQTAFTGDAVLATALLEKLHGRFPESSVDLLVRKGNEGLFKSHPFLNEVLVWDKKKNKLANLFRILLRVRKNRYDHVINLQRFMASGVLTAFSGGRETIGFDKNPLSFLFSRRIPHVIGDGRHETARNQELIGHLTDESPSKPKLYPDKGDYSNIERYKTVNYYCIAPGSVWFTKTWPEEKWIELIRRRADSKKEDTCYLIGSPAEKSLCDRIIGQCPGIKVENLAGRLTLLESAALMEGAAMNYVNDSAPLHFASAMNAPVTAVYCSTIPSFGFGPLSASSRTVETSEQLKCRPCGLHGFSSCPEGHYRCATSISIERVLSA